MAATAALIGREIRRDPGLLGRAQRRAERRPFLARRAR